MQAMIAAGGPERRERIGSKVQKIQENRQVRKDKLQQVGDWRFRRHSRLQGQY